LSHVRFQILTSIALALAILGASSLAPLSVGATGGGESPPASDHLVRKPVAPPAGSDATSPTDRTTSTTRAHPISSAPPRWNPSTTDTVVVREPASAPPPDSGSAPASPLLNTPPSQSVLIGNPVDSIWLIRNPSTQPQEARMVLLAEQALASKLGIPITEITLIGVSQVEWPNSSLGCPTAGQLYSQVVTPGYIVDLEARGQTYVYHTDTIQRVVTC